jgi:hypothetical protein
MSHKIDPVQLDKQLAEEYRQQRQAAEARDNNFELKMSREELLEWIEENTADIMDIIARNGIAEDQASEVLAEYKARIIAIGQIGPFDDLNSVFILKRVLADIEAVCKERGLATRSGVVFGLAPSTGLHARQAWRRSLRQASSASALSYCHSVISYAPRWPLLWRLQRMALA